MLFVLLIAASVCIGFICHARRHFGRLVPPCRIDAQHGVLQVRRYPKLALAEVRVSGSAALALRTGSQLLNRYFREEQIARFALPLVRAPLTSKRPGKARPTPCAPKARHPSAPTLSVRRACCFAAAC